MASLFQRDRSPFWWIKFRDALGVIRRQSTGFKVGIGPDTRRAEQLCAEKTLLEKKVTAGSEIERWAKWVPDYLQLRYADAPASDLRTRTAWRTVRMFLDERQIYFPRQLSRAHCVEYMAWRQKPDKKRGKYRAGHNTAHLEIKILGIVMGEAVLRNYAPFNPCRDLEIKRIRGKEKPEFTEQVISLIDLGIANEPERLRDFFRVSFDIARYHGCRLSETFLNPLTDVDLAGGIGRIRFRAKGGRTHTAPLHPELFGLFARLRAAGVTQTYERPKSPAKEWHKFLKRIGVKTILPNACFHSLRVTVASTLARKSVSEKKAMAYIGHASTTVHRSYVRLKPEDVTECYDAISYGDKSPAPKSSGDPATRPAPGKQTRSARSSPWPA